MRVLIADRDPATSRLLCDMLQAEGFAAKTAQDGVVALSLLRAESWDAMILDAQLPLRSGVELLRTARGMGRTRRRLCSLGRPGC